MSLIGPIIRFVLERQAARRSFIEIVQQLPKTQKIVSDRIANAAENHKNHRIGRHIVGMERWGQHRLRCALGEPLVLDEMDDYILQDSHANGYIAQDFDVARRETLALVQALTVFSGIEKQKVRHNEFGMLSVKAWLVYLTSHAEIESRKLR